jgi:DNA-binding NtrC family response regulator
MANLKVLLVDDEKEFVSTLAERLSLRGIDAIAAYNGKDALLLIDKEQPHVVLLDMMMPGTGGLEVLKRIKERYPQVQVILLTGNISTQDSSEGMRLGAFDFLTKPVSIDDLMEKLRKAMESL